VFLKTISGLKETSNKQDILFYNSDGDETGVFKYWTLEKDSGGKTRMDNPEKQTTNIGHKAQNEEIYLKEKTLKNFYQTCLLIVYAWSWEFRDGSMTRLLKNLFT
jgi:hypothetical protein